MRQRVLVWTRSMTNNAVKCIHSLERIQLYLSPSSAATALATTKYRQNAHCACPADRLADIALAFSGESRHITGKDLAHL